MLTIIADNTVSFIFFLTCLAVHYCFLIWQINAFLSSTLNAMYIRALLSVFIVFTAVSFLVELTNALAKHGDLGCIWRVWRIWHIWCAQRCKARGRSRRFVQQSLPVICNFFWEKWQDNYQTNQCASLVASEVGFLFHYIRIHWIVLGSIVFLSHS